MGRLLTRRGVGLGLAAVAAAPARAAPPGSQVCFLTASKVMVMAPDGSGLRTLAARPAGEARGSGFNDGIAYDPREGRLYWTNMGRASADDGYIQSVGLDGSGLAMVVPPGGTFTPKQLKIDVAGRKLYWSDREGMRVMSANLDGSGIEVLVQTGAGDADRRDASRWCVGVAIDTARGHVYWTQKGGDNAAQGVIRRAPLTLPKGRTPVDRDDIEVLFSGLPEPIDLDLDLARRRLYWTDRGDNTVSSAPMDPPRGADPAARKDRKVLVTGLREAIGVALDPAARRMFYTSLGGEVGSAGLDGAQAKTLLQGRGAVTGIVVVG